MVSSYGVSKLYWSAIGWWWGVNADRLVAIPSSWCLLSIVLLLICPDFKAVNLWHVNFLQHQQIPIICNTWKLTQSLQDSFSYVEREHTTGTPKTSQAVSASNGWILEVDKYLRDSQKGVPIA